MAAERSIVAHTSDALCVLRASEQAARFGVHDPYAAWFVTDAGVRVFELACAVDSTFSAYNLARYVETTRALTRAATRGQQIVVLGAGTDCRVLGLPQLGAVPVFLVDQPAMTEFRMEVLGRHHARVPANVRDVPFDLTQRGLNTTLTAAGWRAEAPTFLLAEGVLIYLPHAAALMDSRWLAADSELWADLWTAPRVERLNAALIAARAPPLFHALDLGALSRLGYRSWTLTPLEQLCARLGHAVPDLQPDSWLALSAAL